GSLDDAFAGHAPDRPAALFTPWQAAPSHTRPTASSRRLSDRRPLPARDLQHGPRPEAGPLPREGLWLRMVRLRILDERTGRHRSADRRAEATPTHLAGICLGPLHRAARSL